ncbi:MAG: heparinase II/III family protein, partial [Sulfuricaulis sp.]
MVYRLRVKFVSSLNRFGVVTLRAAPVPDLTIPTPVFIGTGNGIPPQPYSQAADEILQGRLRVFALDHVCGSVLQWNQDPKTGTVAPLAFAKTLDYRNEALVGDIKYLWEPNRHLHLVTLAQAYHLTGERRYLDGLQRQLESWFDQCPYLKGPNWSSSLELAIRLINWSITWQLIGGLDSIVFSGEVGNRFRNRWLVAIHQHMHFIHGHFSRFSSANNHLIGEAAGLFVGAVTWPYWRQSQNCAAEAQEILEREALMQNAPDGVNREQAVSYQQFVLDFLLIAA